MFVCLLSVDADVICCETVLNPVEMFPHLSAAAAAAAAAVANDDDDIKFVFTIRFAFCFSNVEGLQVLYVHNLTVWRRLSVKIIIYCPLFYSFFLQIISITVVIILTLLCILLST